MFVGEAVELWTLQLSLPAAELSAEARRGRSEIKRLCLFVRASGN